MEGERKRPKKQKYKWVWVCEYDLYNQDELMKALDKQTRKTAKVQLELDRTKTKLYDLKQKLRVNVSNYNVSERLSI